MSKNWLRRNSDLLLIAGASCALVTAAWCAARLPGATATTTVPITGSALATDGSKLTVSGTVQVTITTPAPTPIPGPVPGPGISVDRVTDASGASILSAAGGSIVYLRGSGLGAGGTAKIAGQAVSVIDWQPWAVVCKLPVVATSQSGPVIIAPTGINPATSSFNFTIVGSNPAPNPGPAPVPGPTPGPVPPGSKEWPPGSGVLWKQTLSGTWQPYQPPYPWKLLAVPGGVDYPLNLPSLNDGAPGHGRTR